MVNSIEPRSLMHGFSEAGTRLQEIGHEGYEIAASALQRGRGIAESAAVQTSRYVKKAVDATVPAVQLTWRTAVSGYNLVMTNAPKVITGAVHLYQKGRETVDSGIASVHAGLAKFDRFADSTLPRSVASVAKAAVRVLPPAAIVAGALVASSHLLMGGMVLGATAHYLWDKAKSPRA
jgi:hypothetical protein